MVGSLLVSQVLTLPTPVIYLFSIAWAAAIGSPQPKLVPRRHGLVPGLSSVRRPVATTLLNLSVVLAGAVAFTLLPNLAAADRLPASSSRPTCPGWPETMASTVATPLERALGTIAGSQRAVLEQLAGSTRINVMFDLGKDINVAARGPWPSRQPLAAAEALPGMPQCARSTRLRRRS